MIQKYTTEPKIVKAVLYTGDNFEEILELVKEKMDVSEATIRTSSTASKYLQKTDIPSVDNDYETKYHVYYPNKVFFVEDADGRVEVYWKNEFELTYKLLKNENT